MKLVYKDMGHILSFDGGYAVELVVENRKMFFDMVSSMSAQSGGAAGDFVLSVGDKPVEFSRYADMTLQFTPFQVNRKSLLTKLYAELERNAMLPEHYEKTVALLGDIERYIFELADELPFEICCQKLALSPIIRAVSPEIDEDDKNPIERIFSYMELVRELDRDRLFIMVNMRAYFSDADMERFTESVCLHDFKLLLLESNAGGIIKNTKRYTVDGDLCEF